MKCPIHKVKLLAKNTRYGIRNSCPVNGCTVVCWGNETSTPADFQTRQNRHKAHLIFDSWWKGMGIKRAKAYKLLGEYMELKPKENHIGYFSIKQCKKVLEFVNSIPNKNKFFW